MEKRTQSESGHVVAIVGRPNVGKSAIFNQLAGRRIAIVHDQPGVTRDRISAPARLGELGFTVMDTGGIGAPLDDGFAQQVAAEVDIAIATADLILFVVDAQDGLTSVDQNLAQQLRRSGHPVVLLVNKIDHEKHAGMETEFTELGFATLIPISAAHSRGFGTLERHLIRLFRDIVPKAEPKVDVVSKDPIKLAIVGRPNVGKSSLINAILGDERTIVSEVAGTTRDAIDVPYRAQNKDYILIDTAGIRRRTKRDSSVEMFSVMRSERSIRRADICALVIDAAAGVTAQDRRIAGMILKENKPCVILLNKFDLYHPDGSKSDRLEILQEDIKRELFFLPYAPMAAMSALKEQSVRRIFSEVANVQKAASKVITTGVLNRLLEHALLKNPPPMKNNKRLKILYASLAREEKPGPIPIPHYILFINHANLISDGYLRYLEARLREESPFEGLPVRFDLRARPPRKKVSKKG